MKKTILILIGLLAVHVWFLTNLQFTAWPEMFSYPFLKNNGFELYSDMIHPYPPLLVIILASIYSIFGYSIEVLQIATWVLILSIDVLIFLIIHRLTRSALVSLFSVLLYVLLQPFLEGNMLWFDLAMVAPILLGLYFITYNVQGRSLYVRRTIPSNEVKLLIMAGLSFGVAALIKQTAGLFLILGGVYLLAKTRSFRDLAYYLAGPLVMGVMLLLWQLAAGTLELFINWTLVYPITRWSELPGYVQMRLDSYQLITIGILLLPVLILFVKEVKVLLFDDVLQLLGLFLLGSLLAIYPRFSFFHFQLALALIIIMSGYLVSRYRYARWLYVSYLLLIPIVHRPNFARNWEIEPRFYSAQDSELSSLISEKLEDGETVFLLGLHSGLYSMMGKLPPKPWTDNFGWYLEIDGVQGWVIAGWDSNPPDNIVWRSPDSGNRHDLGVYQPKEITNWITDNYNKGEEISRGIIIWERKEK